jgi:murein DD-endopeptidase MepM/ murein hydrolase activator NlpD
LRRSRAYALTCILLLLTLTFASTAFATPQQDLEESQRKAAEARQSAADAEKLANELKTETEALDKEIASLRARVDELMPKIEDATTRTTQLRDEVEQLRAQIADLEADIQKTQEEYARQQGLLDERMRTSYKQGNLYYFELMLSAKDFNDLIARTTLVQRVIESNQDIAINLADTKRDLESTKSELDRTLENVSIKKAEAEAVEKSLRDLQSERQQAVNSQASKRAEKATLMKQAETDAEKYEAIAREEEAEAARISAQLKGGSASSGSGKYAGTFAWPVPGGTVTSGYGWRTHPIFGTKKFHRGLDISKGNMSVLAAGSGTVIKASYGWGGGYGNRIWIDHGDGLVTAYNHLADGSFRVSSGQSVTKGQRIATVGSTGYSTGPHLHFEARVNGDTANPLDYF